jgi:hypothetical protein
MMSIVRVVIIATIFMSVIYRMDWPLVARLARERELKHKHGTTLITYCNCITVV